MKSHDSKRTKRGERQPTLSENIIEKRGPTSQAAQERGEEGYNSLVGVSGLVYVPLRPGQPTIFVQIYLISIK